MGRGSPASGVVVTCNQDAPALCRHCALYRPGKVTQGVHQPDTGRPCGGAAKIRLEVAGEGREGHRIDTRHVLRPGDGLTRQQAHPTSGAPEEGVGRRRRAKGRIGDDAAGLAGPPAGGDLPEGPTDGPPSGHLHIASQEDGGHHSRAQSRRRVYLGLQQSDEHGCALRMPDEDDRPPVVVVGEIVLPGRQQAGVRCRHTRPEPRQALQSRHRHLAVHGRPYGAALGEAGGLDNRCRPLGRLHGEIGVLARLCGHGRVHVEAVEATRPEGGGGKGGAGRASAGDASAGPTGRARIRGLVRPAEPDGARCRVKGAGGRTRDRHEQGEHARAHCTGNAYGPQPACRTYRHGDCVPVPRVHVDARHIARPA